MTRDEQLREIQKRIAEARGYTEPFEDDYGSMTATLHAGEGPTAVPRWPQEWWDMRVLVEEMEQAPSLYLLSMEYDRHQHRSPPYGCAFDGAASNDNYEGRGDTYAEAVARCWCAWKGIDLSDLT